jgi:hypothetical protein
MSPAPSKFRATRGALLLAVALTVVASGEFVQPACAGNDIVTDVAPPPDRVEHAPPPRDGYIWGPGHWEWNGRSYIWASGTWLIEHRAAHWIAGRWEQVGAQWHYREGHWER